MNERRAHWEEVHSARDPESVTWYQETPSTSLGLIAGAGASMSEPVIDVGGGSSRLVDALLEEGHEDIIILDIAAAGLDLARARLGGRAGSVEWIVANALDSSVREVAVWHDRAVFHFLVEPDEQRRYVERMKASLRVGGSFIVGTFALDGPEKCSGLPVQRWDLDSLSLLLGEDFEPAESFHELHVSPAGNRQHFFFARFTRGA